MSTSESQIIGVRMSPELAREVKAEAAKRGLSVKKLFEELWETYLKNKNVKP